MLNKLSLCISSVHIRLKIPKLINRHTHVETKYIHIFHPTKIHGFHHRKDAHAPQPYNSTSMEIKSTLPNSFEPSIKTTQKHQKINSNEIFNHRYKNVRQLKETDDYDYPTALPSHGAPQNAPNLKYFVLDAPLHENRRENQVIISTTQPLSAFSTPGSSGGIIGTRSLPYTSQESVPLLSNGYNRMASQELIASPSPPQRLNRIPPPIPLVKNSDTSYEEHGKTKYWTASGKKLGKKKPYHGPKKAERAESKRIKMTIRPKIEKKITKLPFIIKV